MNRYPHKNDKAKQLAKELRKNMTKEERHLWYDFLNTYKPAFRRQYVIKDYIVDFYCPAVRLAIELDGSQHYETENMIKDKRRTDNLETCGIKVIRYTNLEINRQFDKVCQDIDNHVKIRQMIN